MDILGGPATTGPVAHIGAYRAADGSEAAPVGININRPHVGAILGKRGYGKSYTLGVLAEELATVDGIAPTIIDPMGTFVTLTEGSSVDAEVIEELRIPFDILPPAGVCELAGVDPHTAAGALLWQAAETAATLEETRQKIADQADSTQTKRAAMNYLGVIESWDLFCPDGRLQTQLETTGVTVLDCSALSDTAITALTYVTATTLYRSRVSGDLDRLPWLLIDEAHTVCEGLAKGPIERIATRGRQPGVSLVVATQRPAAVPPVVISQADLIAAHRLTARTDRDRLAEIAPTYLTGSIGDRLPRTPGEVLLIDDTTEVAHQIRIRQRKTPHGGDSPRVREEESARGGI